MRNIPKNLNDAVGRTVLAEDNSSAAPVAGLMAAFGYEDPAPRPGDTLPPLWHGLFCTAKLPPARLGPDGLAKDEGLLPAAAAYPNKLFGGARFDFRHPLRIGDTMRKESEVMSFALRRREQQYRLQAARRRGLPDLPVQDLQDLQDLQDCLWNRFGRAPLRPTRF